MKRKSKNFFSSNILVFLFIIFAIFIECISLCFVDLKPLISSPLYGILILLLAVSILLIISNLKAKAIISIFLLAVQSAFQIGFIFLYDSNGTFFEWSMMNQRNDAFATIEDWSLRWDLLAILASAVVLFAIIEILLFKFLYKKDRFEAYKSSNFVNGLTTLVLIVSLLFVVSLPTISAFHNSRLTYVERYLYGPSFNKYQRRGITGNAIYEFFDGTLTNSFVKYSSANLENYLYNEADPYLEESRYHGISKGNNLVYILVESFEWYAFLDKLTEEQSQELYPNLNRFMDSGLIATNFYAREKTDTAETLALLGSNPTNKFANYDFPNNEYPFSLPNLFRNSVEDNHGTVKQIVSFHQNDGSFYNRKKFHESVGFDEFFAIEDMKDYGVEDTWNQTLVKGDRTLDSQTVDAMKEEMFPKTEKGEQFMTFYITFAMHGYYEKRDNLAEQGYYDRLDAANVYPESETDDKANSLRTYAAALMDFDKAVGIMLDTLEENNQLSNTTIVMFADHNTYYDNLSYYAKGIEEKYNSELYRIPFMIYDEKLVSAYEQIENGKREITKFTTTADILPTVLDIFGIKGYKNLYLGTSMFTSVESVIFSRAYGIFITDKLVCYSANEVLFTRDDYTQSDFDSFIERAKQHLKKLEKLDIIYNTNYFKTFEYQKIWRGE